jgi:hypothetical protein
MAHSKYEGGARVTTFRLPKLWFDVAKSGVLKYLERYEIQPPILDPEAPQEAYELKGKIEITKEGKEKLRIESNGKTIYPGITNPIEKLHVKKGNGIPEGFSYGEFAPGDGNEGGILPVHSLEKKEYSEKKPTIVKKTVPKDLVEKLKELDPNIIIPESGIKPPEWAKKHKTVIKNTTEIYYPCGCIKDDGLFRRDSKCKLKIVDHFLE